MPWKPRPPSPGIGAHYQWNAQPLIIELAIVFIIRTRKAFWRSRPSSPLAWLSFATFPLAAAVPYLPFAGWFGVVPLPPLVMAGLLVITVLYLLASEATKHRFFTHERRRLPVREKPHV